jgi:hypothetical protein
MESQKDTDTNLFTGLDIRAFWETLRLRWWIIPTVLAISVGFLWAQASNPTSAPQPVLYSVTRVYEARDPTAVLASIGIDPVSVRAFPDASNQVSLLESSQTQSEIATLLGRDVTVSISRRPPSFTLIDTRESDGQSSLIFQSAGVPTYIFTCTEPDQTSCEEAIDAYVAKAAEIRKTAFLAGFTNLQAMLESVAAPNQDGDLATKIAAIDSVVEQIDTSFVPIGGRTDVIDPLNTVRRPTLVFSIGAGLIISLLILLQLTVTDRRLRSARQVVKEIGSTAFIGTISAESDPSRDLLAGVSLQQACLRSSATRIKFVPLSEPTEHGSLERLAAMCDMSSWTTKPFADLTVPEIVTTDETDIAIVVSHRNRDLREDLRTAFSALQRSGQRFGGVLLLE